MFKKSMAALAVLSLSAGLASASEVTLYGIVDNGLLYKHSKVETNGVSTKTDSFALESGISSPSRFGIIKGSEDLGNGMTVSFKLENGFQRRRRQLRRRPPLQPRVLPDALRRLQQLSFGRMGAIGSAAGDFDAASPSATPSTAVTATSSASPRPTATTTWSPTRRRASPASRPRSVLAQRKQRRQHETRKLLSRSTATSASH